MNAGPTEAGEAGSFEIPGSLLSIDGRFESLRFLGQGGMGVVYRATDRRLGRDVALKFLVGDGAEAGARLLREARSQARLTHENACKIYEVGVTGTHGYLVMQYIHGESLECIKDRLTVEQKIRLICQIASALHEAHRLGLVHRDVKPSNIMVEQGEDGGYKPYLMDFGIARDIGNVHTKTAATIGTPAFMAPEQVLGDGGSFDRRVDIYSLGATLYDALCGSPPFADTNVLRLIQRLANEAPVPLRQVNPDIPEPLEAVVMKCLAKDPGQRYESARALGDALQRILDGDPGQVRAETLGSVLADKLTTRKGKAALATAVLFVVLFVVLATVHARRRESERVALLSELGADVKEMELFMRQAYSLPLHDIERDRDVIRVRLREIEQRMAAAGPAGEALAHYALGRGQLALGEPEKAVEHLRQAGTAGYALPELDYAMGLSLGELYKKALEQTERIESREQREARIAVIDARYKQPALRHLRAALGTRLETPAYVEGLIALYEGNDDLALRKAQEAFEKAPWLYEAKKLEGDAQFAVGSRFRYDAAFDYERMDRHFSHATAAYRSASEIARSNPEVHAAECELWIQRMNASQAEPQSLALQFDNARCACVKAISASSRYGASRVRMALAHQVFAWHVQSMLSDQDEIETILDDAVALAQQAVLFSPEDAMAHYVSGAAWRTKVLYLMNRGLDARESIDRAVIAYEEALRLDPVFLWAHNELCSTYAEKALSESFRGLDPSAAVQTAVAQCDRAIALFPSFPYPYINKAIAHYRMARYAVDVGRSPERPLAAALEAASMARARSPYLPGAPNLSGWAYNLQAAFDSDAGRDPSASLLLAERSTHELEKIAPGSLMSCELAGMSASTKALHLLRTGGDPEPALQEARSRLQRLVTETPWDLGYRISRANVEVLALRWGLLHGKVRKAEIDHAAAQLLPLFDQKPAMPQVYQTLAEIIEIRASWLLARRQPIADEVSTGLQLADKALEINPRMAAALAVKGGLHVLAARAARGKHAKREAALRAQHLLAAALRENPLIDRDRRSTRIEVERLLAPHAAEQP